MGKKRGRQTDGSDDELTITNQENSSDVEATFDFVDPNEDMFGSVKAVLSCRGVPVTPMRILNTSDLAGIVCEQGHIGTILSNDEGDVFGIMSLLCIHQYEAIHPIKAYYTDLAKQHISGPPPKTFEYVLLSPNRGGH
eukprot:GHVO01068762.1.p1 GENE.GHVO01068762.1~~GHVO01068762.1.p1  ORF type:complete len:138 (+),score=31.84 GHVO01068762.1:23-436(+)